MRMVLLFLTLGWSAQGAYLSSEAYLNWHGEIPEYDGVWYQVDGASSSMGTDFAYASQDSEYTDLLGGYVRIGGYAKGQAEFSSTWADVYASADGWSATVEGGYASLTCFAMATASDALTVFGLGSGFVDAEFRIWTAETPDVGYGTGYGEILFQDEYYSALGGHVHLLIPFQFGSALRLWMRSNAVAQSLTNGPSCCSGWGANSVELIALDVFDASMAPLLDYRYTTESGAQYNFVGGTYGTVPEPSTFLLLGGGLGLLAVVRCQPCKLRGIASRGQTRPGPDANHQEQ